jgi:hypothetical protein
MGGLLRKECSQPRSSTHIGFSVYTVYSEVGEPGCKRIVLCTMNCKCNHANIMKIHP